MNKLTEEEARQEVHQRRATEIGRIRKQTIGKKKKNVITTFESVTIFKHVIIVVTIDVVVLTFISSGSG